MSSKRCGEWDIKLINNWNEWRQWLRRLGNADLFRRTHWRLTALYSGIFTLFLALFVVIAAALFYWITTSEQEQRITRLAEQEANTIEQFLLKQSNFDLFDDQSLVLFSEDQLFFTSSAQPAVCSPGMKSTGACARIF